MTIFEGIRIFDIVDLRHRSRPLYGIVTTETDSTILVQWSMSSDRFTDERIHKSIAPHYMNMVAKDLY